MKTATQNIERRFEQVRAQILARAAVFIKQGTVETTWRTYRGRRLGPYYRVSCRQRRARREPSIESMPARTSIYLGRSEELAAQVRSLLNEMQRHTCQIRQCRALKRQVRRSLTHVKRGLQQLLAGCGITLKGFEFRGAARAFARTRVRWPVQRGTLPRVQ